MGCTQSNVLDRKAINHLKSSEQEAKANKLDENKTKDAEALNGRNKNKIPDSKNNADPLHNEGKIIKEDKEICKNEIKQLVKEENNYSEESKKDDGNDFKAPITNKEENKKEYEEKKKESEKVDETQQEIKKVNGNIINTLPKISEEIKKDEENINKIQKEKQGEKFEKSNENKKNIEANKNNVDSKNENSKKKK